MTIKGGSYRPKRQRSATETSYVVNCDRCGFIFYSHECALEWTGLFVCKWCWEKRNDQDFVRATQERINVPIPRPESGLPTIICTTRSSVADIAVADCMICDKDDLFSFGYLSSPLDEQDV